MRPLAVFGGPLILGVLAPLPQSSTPWRDPSPHKVELVAVERDVRLEVLDWGGVGRPLVLLAGGGNTAHVFDEFARKLTDGFHVYGVTRRGFGASGFSTPKDAGERLAEDVLAVLDALALVEPVLVGHSIAGAELSAVANARPDRLAGLVYLEAGYPYAFDNGKGATMKEFLEARGPKAPSPGDEDRADFRALQRWEARASGFRMPEAELRQTWDSTSAGRPSKLRDDPGSSMFMSLMTAGKKYTSIPVPALVVFAIPHVHDAWMTRADATVRDEAEAYFATVDALAEKQARAVEEGVPTARVVRLRAMHHVFLSNEADVLREMRSFVTRLPRTER
jgi:pimeloyl-ACP methyl ester carboxylesterase